MPLNVNKDLCMGTGNCELECPDVFTVDDGVVMVLTTVPAPDLRDAVRRAAEACPTGAIEANE